jgi:hypothetical protein
VSAARSRASRVDSENPVRKPGADEPYVGIDITGGADDAKPAT